MLSHNLFSPPVSNIAMQDMIFVIGGPGSGKGTHCDILEKMQKYVHIDTGALMRKIAGQEDLPTTPHHEVFLRQRIRDAIKNGVLLEDKFIVDAIHNEIKKHPNAPGFLIDGCPRTIGQADLFRIKIKACHQVLYFETTEDIMLQRVLARAATSHRLDDNEESFKKRLATYREQTMPVINYLKAFYDNCFHTINSSGDVHEVAREVLKVINPAEYYRVPVCSPAA